MQITKFKRVLSGFLSIAMVLSSGTFSFVNAHAEEETTVAQSSSISISIPDDGSDTADVGSAVHINVKASVPAGSQDTTFVFVTDADVTVEEEIEEVELSQKDRVFSFTLDNSEADAETEFTIGLVSEDAGEVHVRAGYGTDIDAAAKMAEEMEEPELTLIWTKTDSSSTDNPILGATPEGDTPEDDEGDDNNAPIKREPVEGPNTDNTVIEQFNATLKEDLALQDDGNYYVKPKDNSQNSTSFTYTVNYAISGLEDHAPGTIEIRIPAHLFKHKKSTADNTVWVDKCTLSVPEAPSVSSDSDYNYTYDESTDEYILTNVNTIVAASEGVFEFQYVIGFVSRIRDMSVSDSFDASIKITDSKETLNKEASVPGITIDTESSITSAWKNYFAKSEVWQDAWGEKPSDSEDYFYVVWKCRFDHSANSTQNFDIECNDMPDNGGTVIGIHDDGPSINNSNALYLPYTTEDDRFDNYDLTWGGISNRHYYYVLVKYPRSQIPDSGVLQVKNTIQFTITGEDDQIAKTKTATASYTYTDTGFKYSGEGEVSLKKSISKDSVASEGVLTMLEKGNETSIAYDNIWDPPFQNDASVQAYMHTLKDGGDPENMEDYGQNPITVELIDDTFFLGSDFSSKLSPEDYEIEGFCIGGGQADCFSSSYLEKVGDTYYEIQNSPDSTEGFPDIKIYAQFEDEEWVCLGKFIPDNTYGSVDYYTFVPEEIMKDHMDEKYGESIESLPSGIRSVKASYETTEFRTSFDFAVSVRLKPSARVLSIINEQESVQLRNINTLEVYNSKGDYILDTVTEYVGDGAKFVEKQDQELYGRDAFHKTVAVELKRASYSNWAQKTLFSSTNDTENHRAVLKYTVNAGEISIHPQSDHKTIIESGYMETQGGGTLYDLLPKGMEIDIDSLKVSPYVGSIHDNAIGSEHGYGIYGGYWKCENTGLEDYVDYTVETIDNYNGTGRTLVVIHCSMKDGYKNYNWFDKETYYTSSASGYQALFTCYYSWDNIADYGKTLLNSMAYETGNASIADGFPDNGGTISEADIMTDLNGDGNPEGTANTFLYAQNQTTLTIVTSAELSLSKLVKAEGGSTWSNGQDDNVVVPGGGNYSYRLRFGSAAGTTTTNMILFDSLENYTPEGVDEQWHGTLKSIDTSQVESKGIKPVVYYSTVSNLTFDNTDQTGTTDPNRDLTNTGIWSTTAPDDLSEVTAIAVDMRKNANGTDASLAENATISVIVHMQAPTDNLRHLTSEKVGAYNNIYLQDTLTTKAGTVTDQFINYSYTKVLLEEVPVEIHKSSDPETGTKEDPAEVVYQGSLDYDVSVKNTSKNLRLTSLQVQDTIPDGLTIGYDDIKYYYDDNSSDAKPVAGSNEVTLSYEGQSLVFDIQKLDAGSTIHFIIPTTVSKEEGTYVNTAHLTKVNGLDYELDSETTYHFDDYGRLDIKKVDEVSDEAIEGIKFSLYKASVDDDGNWTKVDSVAAGTITTDQNGLGSFTKILPGTYLLYEDSLKIGYYPVKEPWHVTVTAKSATVVTSDGKAVKAMSDTYNGKDITRYIITNKKVEILPDTGSNTALLLTLFGLAGIAGYGIYETLRRRKRNNMAV